MYILLILIVLLAVIFGPQWWAQHTFKRYATPRDDIPGTGAELARHLLKKLDMDHVKVEQTEDNNDHYDPADKAVRLSPHNFNDRSLTAITVAAHEVGHAIQDHRQEPMHALRGKLVVMANRIQQLGAGMLLLIPIVAILTRSPFLDLLLFIAGIASMGVATVVHFVTLPVELDASFNKALPILFQGNYIEAKDRPAARRILKAAALTYVAASLASLLNLWRWIAILRR
ncbi:MAG: peptidase [Gammaproteobacteria bacterium]|nr:peptidase [Gammaproteobacteria bacterium]